MTMTNSTAHGIEPRTPRARLRSGLLILAVGAGLMAAVTPASAVPLCGGDDPPPVCSEPQPPYVAPPNGKPADLHLVGNFSSTATIAWTDNATNETGYQVYRWNRFDTSGAAARVADLPAHNGTGTMTFTDQVDPNRVYSYLVQVVKGSKAWDSPILRVPGPPQTGPDHLPAPQSIFIGGRLTSADGGYYLILQTDGNLVIYRTSDGNPIWAANTAGRPSYRAYLQGDGNFVIYNSGATVAGNALWASGSFGDASTITMQNDGNLVIRTGSGVETWSSMHGRPAAPPTPPPAPTSGSAFVSLPPTGDPIAQKFVQTLVPGQIPLDIPPGAVVDTISIASSNTSMYFDLLHDGYPGNPRVGPVETPGETTSAFAGQPVAGTWRATRYGLHLNEISVDFRITWHRP
jgi:hypothetical protein